MEKNEKEINPKTTPDEDTLIGHIKRSNYVIYMNLHYGSSFINESPSNHGWMIQDSKLKKKKEKIVFMYQNDTINLHCHIH